MDISFPLPIPEEDYFGWVGERDVFLPFNNNTDDIDDHFRNEQSLTRSSSLLLLLEEIRQLGEMDVLPTPPLPDYNFF